MGPDLRWCDDKEIDSMDADEDLLAALEDQGDVADGGGEGGGCQLPDQPFHVAIHQVSHLRVLSDFSHKSATSLT